MLFPRCKQIRRRRPPFFHGSPNVFSGQGNAAFDSWILDINSQRVSPTAVYLASDATGASGSMSLAEHGGDADGTLTEAGGGALAGSQNALFGVGGGADVGILGDGTSRLESAAAFLAPGTDDLVGEAICTFRNEATVLFGLQDATRYYELQVNSTPRFQVVLNDGGGFTTIPGPGSPTVDALYHLMWFIDRSGSGLLYANAIAGTPTVVTTQNLTLSGGNTAMMARAGGAAPYTGILFAAAHWQGAAWLDSHLQPTLVAERMQQWAGILPQLAPRGAYPLTTVRSTTKYYYCSSQSKLHLAGSGLVAVDESGLLIEAAATNLCLRSQTLDNAYWSKTNCSVTADAATAPDGTSTADALHEDATAAAAHYISRAGVVVATSQYVFSCYAKKGNRNWLRMQLLTPTAYADFNLDSGTVGTSSNCDATGIEAIGSGWYRCWIVVTFTTTSTTMYFAIGEGDGDIDFDGLDQDSIYVWGGQLELGNYPSSYIPTTAATVTRNADNVDLNAAIATRLSNAGQGTIECEVLLPAHDLASNVIVWDLSDGTPNTVIEVYLHATGDKVYAFVYDAPTAGADVTAGGDVVDGSWHTISVAWRTNRISIIVDGSEAVDTSCAIPTGLTTLSVGRYAVGAHLNGWIRNMRIWDYARH